MFTDINTANGVLEYMGQMPIYLLQPKHNYWQPQNFSVDFVIITWLLHSVQFPCILHLILHAVAADAPSPLADVYAQIIKDLTEAAADLPNTPAAGTGKPVTKPVALYLLAKTYLWRGWSSAGTTADFTRHIPLQKV